MNGPHPVTQDERDLLQYLTDDELEDASLEFEVRTEWGDFDILEQRWNYWMGVARKRRDDQAGQHITPA